MRNEYSRTDLACESAPANALDTRGARWDERNVGAFAIETLRIGTEDAAERTGLSCGTYLTVRCGRVTRLDEKEAALLVRLLAGELRGMTERITKKRIDANLRVFVAGLGNLSLTADAIGPKTVAKLNVTRHLREHEGELFDALGCTELSALTPGVLGQTGIETVEILRGAIGTVRPDVVIVVDALAARGCDRLATTVQITDVGISPGSGVGNHRDEISQTTMGVPIISIGVPTVVDSSTLVYDALEKASIENIDESLRQVLENGRGFFVSPKDSDLITESFSTLFARAIGTAFADELHT